MRKLLALAALLVFAVTAPSAMGGASCTLDRADQDVKRMFPESTRYRVRDLIPERHGEKNLMETIAKELHSPLDEELDTVDSPRTFYLVYKGDEYIGLIHGVNAKTETGTMQIFVAFKKNGSVRDVYLQKMNSLDAPQFRSKFYRRQFSQFSLANLPDAAYVKPPVRLPSPETLQDHSSFVRATRLAVLWVKDLYNKFHE